jgi:hypothetical protein
MIQRTRGVNEENSQGGACQRVHLLCDCMGKDSPERPTFARQYRHTFAAQLAMELTAEDHLPRLDHRRN